MTDLKTPRRLGLSDVFVSPVTFGAWAVGGWMWGGAEESESIAAIRASVDHGATTIDTAAVYGQGYGEEVVGKAIKGIRDRVQIATKCGMRWDAEAGGAGGCDPWQTEDRLGKPIEIRRNSRPESIVYELEQSLKRLGTDFIDLYQIHWPDTSTPVEDSMATLVKLKDQGKIRAIGVSNYNAEWIRKASDAAPVASLQPPYSLIQRKIEPEILPLCRERNIGVIVYSPLERGLLTGSVGPDRTFPPGDHRASHRFFTVENRKRVKKALDAIQPIANAHNANLAQVVINWTIQEPGITAALVGARNAEQAADNAKAMDFTLNPEERGLIRSVFEPVSAAMM